VLAVGLSAGGNLAAWLAARGYVDGAVTLERPVRPARFRLVAADAGVGSFHRFAPNRSFRRSASPAWHGVDVPILIIHSRREWMPLDQARRLRAASPLGRLVVLDGGDHAMGTSTGQCR
jgi:pimeloyl-ACP methyl ester carboxylesterase